MLCNYFKKTHQAEQYLSRNCLSQNCPLKVSVNCPLIVSVFSVRPKAWRTVSVRPGLPWGAPRPPERRGSRMRRRCPLLCPILVGNHNYLEDIVDFFGFESLFTFFTSCWPFLGLFSGRTRHSSEIKSMFFYK